MVEAPASKPARVGWFRIWLLVMLALLVAGVAVAVVMANPSFPAAPELEEISVEPPRTAPAAPALAALLERRKGGDAGLDTGAPPFEAALAQLKAGRWLDDPAGLLRALAGLQRPTPAAAREALLTPGCLPEEELKVDADRYSLITLMRYAKLAALEAVALTQTGEARRALGQLAPLHDRLLQLQERCAPNLIGVMVIEAALRAILPAWGYLLASGDLPADLRPQVWQRVQALESRKNPLLDAMRQEDRFLTATLAGVKEQSKASPGEERLTSWPWYVEEDTLFIQRRMTRRRIWLAAQPLSSGAWTRRFPEDEYLEALQQSPPWLIFFRYNGTGKALLAIASPSYRKYALRWHQNRCIAAAQRERWARELRARGGELPPPATHPAPLDPFTRKPFGAAAEQCAVPARLLGGGDAMKAEPTVPLPPARAAGPTSAPASAPAASQPAGDDAAPATR